MVSIACPVLQGFFDSYSSNPALVPLRKKLAQTRPADCSANNLDELTHIYHSAIDVLEREIWSGEPDETLIRRYQQLFQELEQILAAQGNDPRHKFIIVIPVADRPRHLQSCLDSLLTLCQSFHYGGYTRQRYPKVTVIIADDTRAPDNIQQHKQIAAHFTAQGIETIYFGLEEQRQQLSRLSKHARQQLLNIVGDCDPAAFYHKGPSIMRNLTYLRLNEMADTAEKLLFYFVDSDQEFQIRIQTEEDDKTLYAINYFYHLDRIFSRHDVSILTGKVIGDPPVSPAVMAGTFLDDINSFLHQMAATKPHLPCQFHHQSQHNQDDAAYHDMADLFGFQPASNAYQYRCSLKGEHDHVQCLADFGTRLNQFFHGEHPTRKSYFNQEEPVADIKQARTIYTGNYLFNSEGLQYFIPFARLKLRMAGPVLGRIIQAESKERFVSANLPMLHKRTVEEIGESEFRPGINREQNEIDLSGEFERQFFGDVMLFSMEKLIAMGYPANPVPKQTIMQTLDTTHQEMRQRYAAKQLEISDKLRRLQALFFDDKNWWNNTNEMEATRARFTNFINNIEQNFGDTARSYALIDSAINKTNRLQQMLAATMAYPADKAAWTRTLENQRTKPGHDDPDKIRH